MIEPQLKRDIRSKKERNKLSARELEIAGLVAEGFTNEQIARLLFISPHTVRSHIRNSHIKLECKSRAHMVAMLMGGWQWTGKDAA